VSVSSDSGVTGDSGARWRDRARSDNVCLSCAYEVSCRVRVGVTPGQAPHDAAA
jgi:hypothetical protein